MEKKGDVVTKHTFVINGEMIEGEGENFIRQHLGMPPITATGGVPQKEKDKVDPCDPDKPSAQHSKSHNWPYRTQRQNGKRQNPDLAVLPSFAFCLLLDAHLRHRIKRVRKFLRYIPQRIFCSYKLPSYGRIFSLCREIGNALDHRQIL